MDYYPNLKINGIGDIEDYFKDCGKEYFEDNQEYLESIKQLAIKLGNDYFIVEIEADIQSEKRDYGDRIYWAESIISVDYTPVTYDELKNIVNESKLNKIKNLKAEIQLLADSLLK
jgi:uncharacterized FAD-dependent dehydrogenase